MMGEVAPVLVGWARSAVTPRGGALGRLVVHEIGAPVVRELLRRCEAPLDAVDVLVCGNSLGAGGNPARMVALAAGIPEAKAAYSIDTQCCSGLDAVILGASLIASGQAQLVVAGGAESWSRSPMRSHRPLAENGTPIAYERPAFVPDAARDPDLILAAARYAAQMGITRKRQDAFAAASHERACAARCAMETEIVPIGAAICDTYPRLISAERAARVPVAAVSDVRACRPVSVDESAVSRLAVSAEADGAAFVLLANSRAAERLGLVPRMHWRGGLSLGSAPEVPMLAASRAVRALLDRQNLAATDLWTAEVHDAFAVQAIAFLSETGLSPDRLNRGGGGIARGHPIGASGAVSLVRLLADMYSSATVGSLGLAAIAAAGGLGSAALVERV